jgi:energy-coupling factor transport system permease protein
MSYRRRASSLHAAAAGAALAWCAALGLAAIIQSSPVVLGALALAVLGAGALAGVWRELRPALWLALTLALTVCVINALLTRDGLTVIWRFGDLPILGQTNVTLEATVYGAVLGLRAATLVLLGALYSLAVDPDQVLTLFRRWSFRSALSATIATRMIPVLIRDSKRLADAQRCRPGAAPGRLQLMRATTSGVLDRALDVAAALEVRGYATAVPAPRCGRRPSSRHDIAFSLSAAGMVLISVTARIAGWSGFTAYPQLRAPAGARELAAALLLALVALAPFADRRGVLRV